MAKIAADAKPWVYKKARVTAVVDGDTVKAEFDLGFRVKAEATLRLFAPGRYVDAWEDHGAQRPLGEAAKAFTRGRLLGKDVEVWTYGADDFGRWLATVFVDGADFCAELFASVHQKADAGPRKRKARPEPGRG